MELRYEWDLAKADQNRAKHGVDFADAALALQDPLALTLQDPDSEAEVRFVTMGSDPLGRLLVVAFTWRGERIRIISARRATRRERHQYRKG